MGTRGVFRVFEKNQNRELIHYVSVYCQYDMYPCGTPLDVAKFLSSKKLTNGIPSNLDFYVFNTVEDVAAQLVTFLKIDHTEAYLSIANVQLPSDPAKRIVAGRVYIIPSEFNREDFLDMNCEYYYDIIVDHKQGMMIKAYEFNINSEWEEIFSGTIDQFITKYSKLCR